MLSKMKLLDMKIQAIEHADIGKIRSMMVVSQNDTRQFKKDQPYLSFGSISYMKKVSHEEVAGT